MDLQLIVLVVLSAVVVTGLDQFKPYKQAVASSFPERLTRGDARVGALGGCNRTAQWLFYQNMCYRTVDCGYVPSGCASRAAAANVCTLADPGFVRRLENILDSSRKNMKRLINTVHVQNALKATGSKTVDEYIGNLKPLIFNNGCYHTKVTKEGVKLKKGSCCYHTKVTKEGVKLKKGSCKVVGGFVCKKAPGN